MQDHPATAAELATAAPRATLAVCDGPVHFHGAEAVHKDGTLSGYRWGPNRKQSLLEKERIAAED